ncbi:MAG: aminoacyl-tRNA hydrolase [Myxococcota bacterium]
MKLVVGLGNPGSRYARSRHNVGFRIVERFAEAHRIDFARKFQGRFGRGVLVAAGGQRLDVGVLEPQTYMNLSGAAVAEALRFLPLGDVSSDLLVVLDDVDLPFGRLRLRPGGGSGGHKGLSHIVERLGRSDFARLRFGVDRPPGVQDTSDYVLQRFSSEQEARLGECLSTALAAVEAVLFEGLVPAMNRYNREAPAEP